jgi:exodeoxyribonuclease VII small subunit
MAQTETPSAAALPEKYEEIVRQLGQLVERLEGGGLSLEEAIGAFEQGVRLARAGSARLDEAERRVELLLENDRTQPFDEARPEAAPRPPARPTRGDGHP